MALVYSRSFLKAISSCIPTRCPTDLWRRLTDLGVSRVKPTLKGCRGGQRKRTGFNHSLSIDLQPGFSTVCCLNSPEPSVSNISTQSVRNLEDEAALHNISRETLNIQVNTFASIPDDPDDPRDPERNSWDNNNQTTRSHSVPKIMLANVISGTGNC